MALIKSSLLADIRGSIGGTTYSRNRGGSYARNRTVPINPQSISQTRARSSLSYWSTEWSGLTSGQRNSWNAYAETVVAINVLGESITYTGQQMFVRANTLLDLANASNVTSAPSSNVQPALNVDQSAASSYDVSAVTLAFTLLEPVTGVLLGFTGPPQSPGATSLKVPYRFFGSVSCDEDTTITCAVAAAARAYSVGMSFASRFVLVDAEGRVSNELFLRGSAVA